MKNSSILIAIADNGIGVEDQDREQIFDPFFTTKETGKGTGLGLFVSHAIIEAHHGKMWMETNDSAGVTLYISLPVDRMEDGHE
jgi:two-component system NtrC family sensor kinase